MTEPHVTPDEHHFAKSRLQHFRLRPLNGNEEKQKSTQPRFIMGLISNSWEAGKLWCSLSPTMNLGPFRIQVKPEQRRGRGAPPQEAFSANMRATQDRKPSSVGTPPTKQPFSLGGLALDANVAGCSLLLACHGCC